MAPAISRPRPVSHGAVPLSPDAVFEIMLRLPAKDLCRLRAVCRNWNRLISDPHFVATHAERHPDPLIVAGYDTCHPDTVCDVMDLTGRVVKQVHTARDVAGERERVTSAELDVICTSSETGKSIRLHVVATGAVYALPEELSDEHIRHSIALAVFGQVASTGEYKVLRMLEYYTRYNRKQTFEVFTVDDSTHARWRRKEAPPELVSIGRWRSVVINGIAYFLSDDEFIRGRGAASDRVVPFDLETEKWTASFRGPLSSHVQDVPGTPCPDSGTAEISICAMNGFLAMANRKLSPYMDLWFLVDVERGLWVKHHSIQLLPFSIRNDEYTIRPLWVLNDGRIVLAYVGHFGGSLRIYSPRSSTFVDVAELGRCCALGVYTGSLLSLANSAG